MEFLIPIFFFITIIACAGMLLGYLDGHRKYKLELHKEDRRLIEARTKELEAENKRVELEYQKALLELEQFDRRGQVEGPVAKPLAVRPQPADPSATGAR